jgi:Tfp pilus assembly protein PilF
VSSILDVLRRQPDDMSWREGRAPSAFGYRLILYGLCAFGIGFLGVASVVLLLAPPTTPPPTTAAAPPLPSKSSEPDATVPIDEAPVAGASRGDLPGVSPVPAPPPKAAVRRARGASGEAPIADETAPTTDHFSLALYYQRAGQFDRALSEYRTALGEDGASAEVHDNLGLLYAAHGQPAEAMREFKRAIDLDPQSVKAHNNRGVALMRADRLDEAATEFRKALERDPQNVEPLVNLALAERASGRLVEARDLLQRALAIAPRNAGSHYNLAIVADESGDTSAAIEHYRAFLEYGGVSHKDQAEQVRARLAALGG